MNMEYSPDILRQCRKRNANLEKALEINRLIAGELQLGSLLRLIMEVTQTVMEAEASSLFLIDSETGDLVFHVALGEKEDELRELYRLPKGSGIAGWCAEQSRSALVADVYADTRFNPEYDQKTGFRTRNMICVPLLFHGECIGVSQVINRTTGSFTETDRQLLQSLAQITAVAIDNARAHQRLMEQQVLRRDLDLARSLQRSFLPATPPEIPGYDAAFYISPAYEVGGDLYDAFQLPDRRIAYLLGDVSGKGVAAALIMSRILRDLRFEIAREGGTAGEMLTKFNAAFSDVAANGLFVTLILLVLDPHSGRLEVANAGHPRPVHMMRKRIWLGEGASGPPAGVLPDARYDCKHVLLHPGETILLYTDGVTEAMNEQGDMVGETGMLAWLRNAPTSPGECIAFLCDCVRRFAGEAHQSDDITLLALGRHAG